MQCTFRTRTQGGRSRLQVGTHILNRKRRVLGRGGMGMPARGHALRGIEHSLGAVRN